MSARLRIFGRPRVSVLVERDPGDVVLVETRGAGPRDVTIVRQEVHLDGDAAPPVYTFGRRRTASGWHNGEPTRVWRDNAPGADSIADVEVELLTTAIASVEELLADLRHKLDTAREARP